MCWTSKIPGLNQNLKTTVCLFTFYPNHPPESLPNLAPSCGFSLITFHSFTPLFVHSSTRLTFWGALSVSDPHWALDIEREASPTLQGPYLYSLF